MEVVTVPQGGGVRGKVEVTPNENGDVTKAACKGDHLVNKGAGVPFSIWLAGVVPVDVDEMKAVTTEFEGVMAPTAGVP